MALPRPSYETLLKAIDELDDHGDGRSCCRNCYSVSTQVKECRDCKVFRCENCRPIYETARSRLTTYLFLGLKLGPLAGVSIAEACQNDVMTCNRCGDDYCTRCRSMREEVFHNLSTQVIWHGHICSECWEWKKAGGN